MRINEYAVPGASLNTAKKRNAFDDGNRNSGNPTAVLQGGD